MSDSGAILFDFDYTLGDSTNGIVLSVNYALEQMGYAAGSVANIKKTIGLSLKDTYFALTSNDNLTEAEHFAKLFKKKADEVMVANAELYSGVKDVLQKLKAKGYKIGIVTTKYHHRIEGILDKYDAGRLIDVIVGSDDVKVEKPNPEGLLWAMEYLGMAKEDVLYVGDSLVDARTAENAKVQFAGVLTGTTTGEEFEKHNPVYIGENILDIYHFIRNGEIMKTLEYGKAICYSGYREGQCPGGEIPDKEQIREDLEILLADGYRYIRMYEPNEHTRSVLEHIRENHLPFQCIVGVDNWSEVNNPDCPWDKQDKLEEELAANARRNDAEVEKLIAMVKEFPEEIFAVSVGNENTPCWTARVVPVDRLIAHARRLKEALDKPVTFCEGAPEWRALGTLAAELDFISVHSYPLHTGNTAEEALEINKAHYAEVCELYPDKCVIFTEVGWSSKARDDLKKPNASEENQKKYIHEIEEWFAEEKIIGFLFEAFDEPWKGEAEDSCERNWGLYYVDRAPKPVRRK